MKLSPMPLENVKGFMISKAASSVGRRVHLQLLREGKTVGKILKSHLAKIFIYQDTDVNNT